jgi:hypothetical protein
MHHIGLSWSHHLGVIHDSEPLTLFQLLRLHFPTFSLNAWGAWLLLPRDFTAAFQSFISQVNVLVIIVLGMHILVIDFLVIFAMSVALLPSLSVDMVLPNQLAQPLFFDDGRVAWHDAGLPSLL